MKIWKEVLDDGKRKGKWDGNGSVKEFDVKKGKEKKSLPKLVRFKYKLFSLHLTLLIWKIIIYLLNSLN